MMWSIYLRGLKIEKGISKVWVPCQLICFYECYFFLIYYSCLVVMNITCFFVPFSRKVRKSVADLVSSRSFANFFLLVLLRSTRTMYAKLLNMTKIIIGFAKFAFSLLQHKFNYIACEIICIALHSCACTMGIGCLTPVPIFSSFVPTRLPTLSHVTYLPPTTFLTAFRSHLDSAPHVIRWPALHVHRDAWRILQRNASRAPQNWH
jgi:hypothetical protein